MSNSDNLSNTLFLKLKNRFPEIRLGDVDGMSTVDPTKAVFFDFDFKVNGEKLASISISTADEASMKLFYTKDILKNQSNLVKSKWFDFLRDMRSFAKSKLLSFDPKDITKKNLDRRDFKELAITATNNTKDLDMSESSLYGSTRSSYQKLENTKLIIRHSKKIQEESPNSRTRNIDSVYVESESGERFKYPFIHLSGARAMQRHVANGGNPYDSFGQYIVGLSEQVYNLRRFNHLVSRNSFLENVEIAGIASAAKGKTAAIKKTLERVQKQSGYVSVKESFIEYKKTEIDQNTLESLKNKFTLQQFNEELIELFPYISDLIDETLDEAAAFVKGTNDKDGDYSDKDAADEPIDIKSVRDDAYELMQIIDAASIIKMEPFSKEAILKAIDGQQAQIKEFRKVAAENPKDKKAQYAVEKAEARLGLLQARLGTADPRADNAVTKNALTIEHLATHVKDDKISLLLSRISDDYQTMSTEEKKEVNMLIRKMMSKVKIVPMFASENTTYEELESMLSNDEDIEQDNKTSEATDLEAAYEELLNKTISEKSDLLSTDEDVRSRALDALNELMAKHFPVGTNGMNAIESLRGIIDDTALFQEFKAISKEDADTCIRPIIMKWIESNAPDLTDQIDTGDMETVTSPKESEEEKIDKPKEDNQLVEVEKFVKSLYDGHTGRFPRGEMGVLTSVEKKFGEGAVNHAQEVIETLKQNFDENIMRMRRLAGVS